MNDYRKNIGLSTLIESSNLVNSSSLLLDSIEKSGNISHFDKKNNSVLKRGEKSGSTAYTFGEIVGFATTYTELFTAWLQSPSHKEVLEDSIWNWVGISSKFINNSLVAVIDFSDGNLGSSNLTFSNNLIVFSASYIIEPTLATREYPLYINEDLKQIKIYINDDSPNNILFLGTRKKRRTDRVEIFLYKGID